GVIADSYGTTGVVVQKIPKNIEVPKLNQVRVWRVPHQSSVAGGVSCENPTLRPPRGQVGVDLAGAVLDAVPSMRPESRALPMMVPGRLLGINSKSTLGRTSCRLSLPQFFSSLSFLAY